MYSGAVQIDESNPNRTLFFVFMPSTEPVDEVTIWLQGRPGCSSLYGFFKENEPIGWVDGTGDKKDKNPYAWSSMTNMLWVENGVGVGFSKGRITARTELGTARDLIGFFENWEKLFGIRDYKTFLTACSIRWNVFLLITN
jgi:carboxypeptidase D